MARFVPISADLKRVADEFIGGLEQVAGASGPAVTSASTPQGNVLYERNRSVRGPMSTMGYDYLADKVGAAKAAALRLPSFQGGLYAYEALNFVDGQRIVSAIRDALAAEFGPVPVDVVAEYLAALESVGLIRRLPTSSR
jgi:hypothetical protein